MAARPHARMTDRDYSAWLVGAILVILLAGFSRSFYLLPFFQAGPEWAAPERIFYLHGAVFTLWYVLLAVQTWLIRAGSQRLHRRLGYGGAGLAAGIVLFGTYSALVAANRAPNGFLGVPFPPEQFLIVPLLGVALFAAFVTLAVVHRNRAATHKRLILLGSISLLGAPIARLPLMFPVLPFWLDAIVFAALLAAMIVWDLRTRRRLHPVTLWGGIALIGLNAVALPLIAPSAAWQASALWMMGFAGGP